MSQSDGFRFRLSRTEFKRRRSFKGRIHSAIVSGVNWDTRSVTVEWYERGETKGKEVEIDTILALNPELVSGGRHHAPPVHQQMPNRLAR
ncbi:Kinesin-like protein Klp10A, partial [Eumeta japonica]